MNIEDAESLVGYLDAMFRDVLCDLITHLPPLADRRRSIPRLQSILRVVDSPSTFLRAREATAAGRFRSASFLSQYFLRQIVYTETIIMYKRSFLRRRCPILEFRCSNLV